MPVTQPFRIGLLQMSCSPDPDANLSKASAMVSQAAARGGQVICLQELYRSLYFCQREDAALFDLAETIPGPSTEAMSALARQHGIVIIVPVFEKRATGLYHNSAVVIDAGGSIAGVYRKMHIPDDPGFYEKFYFAPGDLGFLNFGTRFGRIAVLICWDQWYPEGARLAALGGASVIFYPTAIGWGAAEQAHVKPVQREAWKTMHRAHAIANGVFVAAPNRTGVEDGITFWGTSLVCGPFGEILAEASTGGEEILIAECDPARIEEVRRGWPFLRDRRIDAYGPILNRWNG